MRHELETLIPIVSYEQRLESICDTVKDKSYKWWANACNEKKMAIIQLGRMLEKQRTNVIDIKSHLCSRCGKPNKIPKHRTICYPCQHALYDKKGTEENPQK